MLFEQPILQMYVHWGLSMTYLVYICRPYIFDERSVKYVEVLSELMGLILSALLLQFTRQDLGAEQGDMVSNWFIGTASLFILTSLAHMV